MSPVYQTLEARIARSDSRDPWATCWGQATLNQQCEDDLPKTSAIARLDLQDAFGGCRPEALTPGQASTFFCWRHGEQAQGWKEAHDRRKGGEIGNGSDASDLARMLNELRIDGADPETAAGRVPASGQHRRRVSVDPRGSPRRNIHPVDFSPASSPGSQATPFTPASSSASTPASTPARSPPAINSHSPRKADQSHRTSLSAFLCMPQPHTRVLHSAPAARRAQLPERPLPVTSSTAPAKISVPPKTQPNPVKARAAQSSAQNQTPTSARVSPPHDQTQRPSPSALRKPSTDTAVVLSLVPLSVPGPIAATIVKELTTELSSSEEPGYIYIFRHEGTVAGGATVGMRILLKIGRSTNVQRRLKQWEQRCGRKLILMASFPAHTPSSPSSPSSPPVSSSPAARRGVAPKSPHSATDVRPDLIPYSHRVERLIHLELAPCRVSHTCDTCGSTHREWFEVRDGEAAAVMGAVRRWVRWAEGHREG